ncbi:MAG: phosphoribosylaminoimidazolesuccinocarboxamide synthase [Leptospiraceae bacterium]|nr:phosphoribosylaminoimidazolesuccinocarboxamide synthase [Leptospiraceae bacterium]MCP5511903.1 phosphoribosylaminoimidazolesuccinocarboxamide synthase [Leptospiraceae bacterium]
MEPFYRGKVRDIYKIGNTLLLCNSDRISAFDCIFKEEISGKGAILNRISNLWFSVFSHIPNHLLETEYQNFPTPFNSEEYRDRSVLVRQCQRIDFECVVRGYVSGSAWKEYKTHGTIAGVSYRQGLKESEKLPEPIFTPAVKNDTGHDENISEAEMEKRIGRELFLKLKNYSLELYSTAALKTEKVGILLCDTKFEFGILDGEVTLIDELLTPDSSRYWDASEYKLGISPPSYDKQILRNYLESINWNKEPPPPSLPISIQNEIIQKYKEIEEKLNLCISEK